MWLAGLVFVSMACDNSSSDDPTSTDTQNTNPDGGTDTDTSFGTDTASETDTTLEIVSSEEMLARSLLSAGNNVRVKALLDKAANGEEVTLAYIGGSITEGYTKTSKDSYVVGSYEMFKARFGAGDGSNVNYVNAGMGGTPSTLGMIRYHRDVTAVAPSPPDLVFVEFAVNDGDDTTNGAAYESLVRTILLSENHPAVVLLFSVFKSRWNLEDRLVPVGEHYNLPMISIKAAVEPELDAGTITDDEFFRDDYHPTSYGFRIMSETIDYYFRTVAAAETDAADVTVPDDAVIGKQFTGIVMVDPNTETVSGTLEVDPGSFTGYDDSLRVYEWSMSKKTFDTNWQKETPDSNDPFRLTVTCKNAAIVYKESTLATTYGTAEAYVDGTLVQTMSGYDTDAWNNPWTIVLFEEEEAASHTIEIRMAEADADKQFTILAFGYTP